MQHVLHPCVKDKTFLSINMMDGAFFKHTHFFSRLIHFMVHEVPLRQKEAYAPP
jgi:hypothetical protein